MALYRSGGRSFSHKKITSALREALAGLPFFGFSREYFGGGAAFRWRGEWGFPLSHSTRRLRRTRAKPHTSEPAHTLLNCITESKLQPIVSFCLFLPKISSSAWPQLPVFASRSNWFIAVSVFVTSGQITCDDF